MSWIKYGERSTKLFHQSVIQKCSQNRILVIKDSDGEILETREEIEEVLGHDFQDIMVE